MDARIDWPAARRRKYVAALIIVTSLLMSPVLLQLTFRATAGSSNPINKWLPRTEAAETFRRSAEKFQLIGRSQNVIMVSWEGCNDRDDRVQKLIEALKAKQGTAAEHDWHVTHSQLLIEEIVRQPNAINESVLRKRLAGSFIARDGETMVLSFTPPSGLSRELAFAAILNATKEKCGLSTEDVHLLGPVVSQLNLDRETYRVFFPFSIFAALLTLTATWYCLRSVVLVFLLMLSALHGAASGLAVMAIAGVPMSALHTMLPALWFVLGISASTHLLNYLREAYESGKPFPVAHSVRHALRPSLSATATTIFGLLSLCVSNLVPVREFGLWGAIGLTVAIFQIYLLLPSLLTFIKKEWLFKNAKTSHWFADRAHRWTGRFQIPLLAGALLLTIACVFGLKRLSIESGFYPLFANSTKLVSDLHWFEKTIGPQGNLQLIVRFDGTDNDRFMSQVNFCFEVSQQLEQQFPGCECLSPAHFLSLPNLESRGVRASAKRSAARSKLFAEKQRFLESGAFSEVDGAEFMINLFIPVAWENDREFPRQVENLVQNYARAEIEPEIVGVTVTGNVVLNLELQGELRSSFLQSTFFAALAVFIAIVLGLGSFKLACLAILPNAFPIVFAFGLLGWLGLPIDLGSIMTSSIALGIADDDTFHYLVSYQRQKSNPGARLFAMRETCPAMIQSSLICGTGMLIFLFSDFIPAARFGTLLAAILAAALLGDLIILSAELAFVDRFSNKTNTPPSDSLTSQP